MSALHVCKKTLLRGKDVPYRFYALRQLRLADCRNLTFLAFAIGILCNFLYFSPNVLAMGTSPSSPLLNCAITAATGTCVPMPESGLCGNWSGEPALKRVLNRLPFPWRYGNLRIPVYLSLRRPGIPAVQRRRDQQLEIVPGVRRNAPD